MAKTGALKGAGSRLHQLSKEFAPIPLQNRDGRTYFAKQNAKVSRKSHYSQTTYLLLPQGIVIKTS